MTTPPKNDLLETIAAAGIDILLPHLTVRELRQGEIVADTGSLIERLYFPHSAVLSCVVGSVDGAAVAGGLIGKDGVFGAMQALDSMVSLNRVFVMVPGTASVIDAGRLVGAVEAVPVLRRILLGYEQFFLAQVQQTAACNALHDAHGKTCRWLLRLHELAGSSFPLTQESLALMMGVRRTTVTDVAGRLQDEGLISYSRGRMELKNVKGLRKRACACQQELESHHALVSELIRKEAGTWRRPRAARHRRSGDGSSELEQ